MKCIAVGLKILSILFAAMVVIGPQARAAGGNGSGGGSDGGTDELVVHFAEYASALLDHVDFESKDLALLKFGLESS